MQGGGQFTLHGDSFVHGAMGSLGDHQDLVPSLADGLSSCFEDSGGGGHRDGGRGFEVDSFPLIPSLGWAEQNRACRQRRGCFPQIGFGPVDYGGHQGRDGFHIGEILGRRVTRERGQHRQLFLGQAKLAHQENGSWRDNGGRAHQGVSFPPHPRSGLTIPGLAREVSSGPFHQIAGLRQISCCARALCLYATAMRGKCSSLNTHRPTGARA